MKIYLASGWFNPTQAAELDRLEEIFDNRSSFFNLAIISSGVIKPKFIRGLKALWKTVFDLSVTASS